jgi:PRC-barrel domain
VLGPDNARIGSVNDLLFDGTGKIIGVVVGVGGFLGIGTKNVAIDMSAFNAVPAESSGKDNAPTSNANDPTNVKLKVAWTKDQLKDALDFQYYKPPARTAAMPSPGTTGSAPRSPAPAIPRPQAQ